MTGKRLEQRRRAKCDCHQRTAETSEVHATTKFKSMLGGGTIVVAPGAFDGLSARLVEQAGFPAVYASGGAIARSTGVPDIGLITPDEIVQRLAAMVEAVGVPVIADADTGYGNALTAQRAARAFERAGVAAPSGPDSRRMRPLRRRLVLPPRMVQRLHAVRDAPHDHDFVVIGRTDAIAVEGYRCRLDRAAAYLEAGADMIFVEAPTTEQQIADIARRLPGYKLINMFHGGKTPLLPASRLQEFGYHVVIIPSDTQRAAIKAMQRVLATIARDGSAAAMIDDMASFRDREAVVDPPAISPATGNSA
jgi:2-methylisocitrate lyase-like PEP mutase family enzyme